MKKDNLAIIVGNGFDIASGYKTSYGDFIQSAMFEEIKDNNLVCFIREQCMLQAMWVDIEIAIGDYSKFLVGKYGGDNESVNKSFLEDYLHLREALFLYLKGTNRGRSSRYLDNLIRKWINENQNIQIINFNYTMVFEGSYNTLAWERPNGFSNIHGRIDDNYDGRNSQDCMIQLGVDESQGIHPNHHFILKSNSLDDFENSICASNKIIVYGCSFGITDARYFKFILNEIGLSNKKLIIYHYGMKSFDEIKSRIYEWTGKVYSSFTNIEYIDNSINKGYRD